MHLHDKEKMKAVVLTDLLQNSLPRVKSIHSSLVSGGVVSEMELEFIHHELDRIMHCYRDFESDEQCMVIFSSFSHLLYEVVNLAMENEENKPQA